MISIVAAYNKNRIIGDERNDIPWYVPEDLQFFKKLTSNSPIIMGRKTFDSIGRPLPKRLNIVLTRSATNYYSSNLIFVNTFKKAIKTAKNAENIAEERRLPFLLTSDNVYVIGGAVVYRQAIVSCADRMYISLIDDYSGGCAYFPEFSLKKWKLVSKKSFGAKGFDHQLLVYDKSIYFKYIDRLKNRILGNDY